MLIIDNMSTQSVHYSSRNTKIRMVFEDNLYKLKINDIEYASSESFEVMNILYNRLMIFCERYRRLDDTFDVARELKIAQSQVEKGQYKEISIDNLSTIACPTYTS